MGELHTTIASLYPRSAVAFASLELVHNRALIKEVNLSEEHEPVSSGYRETTPQVQFAERLIVLSLKQPSRDALLGFMFGSDSIQCDVLLCAQQSTNGISRVHFRIGFDSKSRALMVYDLSSNFTLVHSEALGRTSRLKRTAIPVFDRDCIQAGHAQFQLSIPLRKGHDHANYMRNLDRYLETCLPRMESLTTQQSQVKTYLEPHKLVLAGQIGEGLSAKVYRAIDGNGFTYAVKVFRPSAYAKSGGQLIQREIDAASDLKHDHIVSTFMQRDVEGVKSPFLVMHLLENGTLKQLGPFKTDNEAALMGAQVLDAALYIHVEGYTHRDIKPDNILVKSVSPLTFQLSDFGFTSRTTLKTFCGTHIYAAPEIYTTRDDPDASYSSAVDIWAIGVVILEYSNGLCPVSEPFDAHAWFSNLDTFLTALRSRSSLTQLVRLADYMLNPVPQERPLAQACLTAMKAILRSEVATLEKANRKRPADIDIDISSIPVPSRKRAESITHLVRNPDKIMTKKDLRRLVNQDHEKVPPVAVNLTRICYHLEISRDVLRQAMRKEAHYVIRGKGTLFRGTYVTLELASQFLSQRRPEEVQIQAWLQEIATSFAIKLTEAPRETVGLVASQGPSITAPPPLTKERAEPATLLGSFDRLLGETDLTPFSNQEDDFDWREAHI